MYTCMYVNIHLDSSKNWLSTFFRRKHAFHPQIYGWVEMWDLALPQCPCVNKRSMAVGEPGFSDKQKGSWWKGIWAPNGVLGPKTSEVKGASDKLRMYTFGSLFVFFVLFLNCNFEFKYVCRKWTRIIQIFYQTIFKDNFPKAYLGQKWLRWGCYGLADGSFGWRGLV